MKVGQEHLKVKIEASKEEMKEEIKTGQAEMKCHPREDGCLARRN
jgi:hypothetical protein